MITLYNVISSDGYIARKNGEEDFIPDELWHRTLSLYRNYEVLVMGRKTYEAIQGYGQLFLEPLEKLNIKKIVVTSNKNFQVNLGYEVVNNPEDIIMTDKNILVCSGPTLNNYLLQNKMIKNVIFHQLQDSIKDGIKPFDDKFRNNMVVISESETDRIKEILINIKN